MKTKKITLTMLLLVSSIGLFAQLNPIQNLYYHMSYQLGNTFCPSYNCFTLTWEEPIASNDSVIGYNIYKNQELYRFTSASEASCSGSSPCSYPDFFDGYPFWVKIKAVYNYNNIESIANDSIPVTGVAINIDELDKTEFAVIKNPIKIGDNISLLFPYVASDICNLQVTSQSGQIIKQFVLKNVSNSIVNISSAQLTSGLYIIKVKLDKKTISIKLIIEK